MKLRFLILFSLLIVTSVQAQKAQNIYYLKNNGEQVQTKDKADFVRIIEEPDSADTRFKLFEFYNNGQRKKLGYLSAFEPNLIYEGHVIGYDSLGRRSEIVNYKNGMPSGSSLYYHSNGKLYRETEYIPIEARPNQILGINSSLADLIFGTSFKIIFDADSSGKVNIENGKGHLKVVDKYKEFEKGEEGDYLNGMKNGVWTGYDTRMDLTFKEVYDGNKFISGESLKDGKAYSYTSPMQAPEYRGGIKSWNNFIATTTKYPQDAYRNGIRGTVKTSFVVDVTGRITDIVIEKSVDRSLDEEAIRVLKYSSKWEPGKERGVPVKVKYNQSFNFAF